MAFVDMIVDALPDFFRQPLMPAELPLVQPGELLDGQWYWVMSRTMCAEWFTAQWDSSVDEDWGGREIRGPIPRPPEAHPASLSSFLAIDRNIPDECKAAMKLSADNGQESDQ